MKNVTLSAIAAMVAISALTPAAEARPYPDTVATCYAFTAADLDAGRVPAAPCVIRSGYGAGGDYTVFVWGDGSETRIVGEDEYNQRTRQYERRYLVNDTSRGLNNAPGEWQSRGVWFELDPVDHDDAMPCFASSPGVEFCYRISQ